LRRYSSSLLVNLLYLIILFVPFDIFAVFSFKNRGVKPVWFFGLLFIFIFFCEVCIRKQNFRVNLTGKSILLFNVIAVITLINLIGAPTYRFIDFGTLWLRLIWATLLFFSITNLNLTDKQLKKVLKIWITLAFIISLYGIYQFFARSFGLPLAYLPILNPSLVEEGSAFQRAGLFGSYVRPSSVFAEPGFFGYYLLSPIILLGFICFIRKNWSGYPYNKKSKNIIIFIILISAFILSFSLGPLLVLLCVMLIAFINKKLMKIMFRLVVIVFFVVLILGFVLKPILKENMVKIVSLRIQGLILSLDNPLEAHKLESPYAKNSLINRYKRGKSALSVWSKNPLIGVGLNNFQYYYPENIAGKVHSAFIQVLAEMGIIGFIGFSSIFFSAFLIIRKNIFKDRKLDLYQSMLYAFYYIIWANLFKFFISGPWANETFWIDLSLATLITYWIREKNKSETYGINKKNHASV